MTMFQRLFGIEEADEEMARAKKTALNQDKIAAIVAKLRLAIRDKAAFEEELETLANDKAISAPEVVEIARRVTGSTTAKSRKAALTALAQERIRISHAHAKAESARKARVW